MSNTQGKQDHQAWARWEYTPDEWAQLDRMDWQGVAQRHWLAIGITIPGSLLALALSIGAFLANAGTVSNLAFFLTLFLFFLLILYAQFFWKLYDKAKKRHQARQKPAHPLTVTLSSQGIWEAGTYLPLGGLGIEDNEFGVKLLDVYLTSQPATLHFRVQYLSSYRTDQGSRSQTTRETIHLLVPRGHEHEAAYVAQRFRNEVIEAREHAKKRAHDALVNPPEPG